jgi:hypothetical protein
LGAEVIFALALNSHQGGKYAMRRGSILGLAIAIVSLGGSAHATVFVSEVVFNPPGSLDDFREYIELQGTPGKKLDGYAIAFLNGTEEKYYPRNSIPPIPSPTIEIDEFFSLDGLALGPNGLLVLAIANRSQYPEVLSDSAFVGPWASLWNGQLDPPGKLQNDGSNTLLLIRNRPGATQARRIPMGYAGPRGFGPTFRSSAMSSTRETGPRRINLVMAI